MDNVVELEVGERSPSGDLENYPNRNWIEAGIKILREKGMAAVSVDTICEEAGMEVSDFNQAFNGLEAYLFAVLDFWYEKEVLAYIDMMDEISGEGEDFLMSMMEIIAHADKEDEVAIRNWALKCPNAHKALARVDRTRLDYTIGVFREMGFSENESTLRAKILYTSVIGLEYSSISASLEKRLEMAKFLCRKD